MLRTGGLHRARLLLTAARSAGQAQSRAVSVNASLSASKPVNALVHDRLQSSFLSTSTSSPASLPHSQSRRIHSTSIVVRAAKNVASGSGAKSDNGAMNESETKLKSGAAAAATEGDEEDSQDAEANSIGSLEFGDDESNDQWDEGVDEEFGDEEVAADEEGFEDEYEVFEDAQAGRVFDTMGLKWAETALDLARQVVAQEHMRLLGLELYAFRTIPASKRLDIRLDKIHDAFGSPSLDDVEVFSRDFVMRLEEALGEEEAGQIEIEVSSPGAERPVSIPRELLRFKQLPMRVEYELEAGKLDTKVFNVDTVDEARGVVTWCLADVRVNRGDRGRPMTKKQRSLMVDLPLAAIKRVNLYIDV